ncbi:MAG: flagellar basal body rod protein FlgG [Candidatus Hydrogenedentota bacterium]
MIQGLYAAATGMIALEERHAIIANNLANASTSGFKRQGAVQEGFYQVFLGELGTPQLYNAERGPGGGLKTIESFADFSTGPLQHTGNPLNVALMGPGFIAVDTPGGVRYTRDGNFTIDANGQLVTNDGFLVQGAGGGGIDVSGGRARIDGDGIVWVDGIQTGQLGIIEFADPGALLRQGDNLFAANPESLAQSAPATETTVVGESLEASNVQVPEEMASMILGMRAYTANQKVISSVDETVGRLINDVGSPA